jgi:tRNA(Ile)-lysidine synthase
MISKIINTIKTSKMLKNGDNIIVALSGGADSVCLLHIMSELSEMFGVTVSACHINHNLRGAESNEDENFCRKLCSDMNVNLEVFPVNLGTLRKKHRSVEECARDARYDIFGRFKDSKTAVAHNSDDNAETVILNLIRGTGLKGLCGIPPARGNIIRPLIGCSRKEIEQYLLRKDIDFVTDSTNLSDDYSRNKVRHRIMPAAEEINPSFLKSIERMNRHLRSDEEYLSEPVRELRQTALTPRGIEIQRIVTLPEPVLRRFISAELVMNKISPSETRISGIEKIILSGRGKLNIARNKFAVVSEGFFRRKDIVQNYRLDKFS